jgi:hypothetical protein
MDADRDAINRFQRALEPLVDRICLLGDSGLADQREELNRIRVDYYEAYVSHGEQFAREIIGTREDWGTLINMARTMAKPEATTPREWLVQRIAGQWATKARSVTLSFRKLNEMIGRGGHAEAERRMRLQLRELYAEPVIAFQTPLASATGLAALLNQSPSARPLPSTAIPMSDPTGSDPGLKSVVLDQAASPKSKDLQELRTALQRALLKYTADELSQLSAGVINVVGVDGETIRRIADGKTRNPHADTRRQLRQTMIKLGYLSDEEGRNEANRGEAS